MKLLEAEHLTLRYQAATIIDDLHVSLKQGRIYSIIGPNGCGKSTLLKSLARQLKPSGGHVLLNGRELYRMSFKTSAKELSYLAQSQEHVDVTVQGLVGYGRTPHQSFMHKASEEEAKIIDWAISATGLGHLRDRRLPSLSGGERQRAWIAMALAQQPKLLLLDEPTTYLDIAHQIEVLELIRSLNATCGMTIVMVLHDMNHAAMFSDEIIAMKQGAILGCGTPSELMQPELLRSVFGVEVAVEQDRDHGKPICRVKGLAKEPV